MDIWKKFNPTKVFTIEVMLDFYARVILGLGRPFVYTGSAPLNTEVQYNALNFSGETETPPTWIELNMAYGTYIAIYNNITPTMEVLHEMFDNQLAHAVHTHVMANVTDLSSAMAVKVNGKSGMYLHEAQATSDSSSVITIHLTADGLSTGTALFSGVPKVVATGKDSTGSPIASPQVAELAWSNSNKTVTFKTSRATNMLLLGNSGVNTGAGVVVDIIAYGTKA